MARSAPSSNGTWHALAVDGGCGSRISSAPQRLVIEALGQPRRGVSAAGESLGKIQSQIITRPSGTHFYFENIFFACRLESPKNIDLCQLLSVYHSHIRCLFVHHMRFLCAAQRASRRRAAVPPVPLPAMTFAAASRLIPLWFPHLYSGRSYHPSTRHTLLCPPLPPPHVFRAGLPSWTAVPAHERR